MFPWKQMPYEAIPYTLRRRGSNMWRVLPAWCVSGVSKNLASQYVDSLQLQLDKERECVADLLDRASVNCKALPAADQVWMQVKML